MDKNLRILHLEDDSNDSLLVRMTLQSEGMAAEVTTVSDREAFVVALARKPFDLVLADYRLPAFDGIEALSLARRRRPEIPFIFVTGAMGEERAIETMKQGATDYVLKDRLSRLGISIRRALSEAQTRAERRHAEQALHESEKRLRLALEGGKMGLWELDLRTQRWMWNARQSELLGLPKAEGHINEEAFFSHVHPEDRTNLQAIFAEARDHACDLNAEFRIIRADDGQVRWLASKGSLFLDDAGHPERIVGVNYDITERRETEEALRETGKRKDEFLAMLAHELRNPLAPIRNATQLVMLTQKENPLVQRNLEIVDRQVSYMARLLDDLLDVARVTQGKISLSKEPQDLRRIAMQAAEIAEQALKERPVKLRWTKPPVPCWVEGDAVRLEQIATNLLTNAMKFTEAGEIEIRLERESLPEGAEWAILQVRDTGIGIPAQLLPSVFDLFTQGEQSLGRARGGLGIGLSLVKRLAEMHGGAVEARSDGIGQGSIFLVKFPLISVPDAATANGDQNGREAPPESGPEQRMSEQRLPEQRLKVLIVEDNELAAQLLAEVLETMGYDVAAVYSGPAALEKTAQRIPDVILLDLGMPGMDGLETASHLRSDPKMDGVKIIAMTGYGHEKMKRTARELGFDDYLIKPVDTQALGHLLKAHAGRRPSETSSSARQRSER